MGHSIRRDMSRMRLVSKEFCEQLLQRLDGHGRERRIASAHLARALDAMAVPVPHKVALAEERLRHWLQMDASNRRHGDVC